MGLSSTTTITITPAQRVAALGKTDTLNLSLLLLAFACVVALVPPVRSYPITDDWIYAHSVSDLLNWTYKGPEWAQATSFGHIACGALFAALLWQSFTVLTISTLAI